MSSRDELRDELAFLADAGHGAAKDHSATSLLDHQLVTSPLLAFSALDRHMDSFPSRGLLGTAGTDSERLYFNTNAPSSGLICGVQGSGKSHSLSCILENALLPDSRIGQLPKPLAALVCHYDEEDNNRPCEAAHLSMPSSSLAGQVALPRITVLCSPSNIVRRKQAYAALPNVEVHPLYLSEQDLTAPRMLAIMGCDNLDTMPLYMHSALMIVRSIGSDAFKYQEFRKRLDAERLNPMQRAMCKLRLELLDAFLRPGSANLKSYFSPGQMVLVDLTDPFLDGLTAAVLFDIVLGAFMQWQTNTGKMVVLDEAHKYLTNSDSARLTRSLASIIRQQRHLATRIIIATQEPTVVPPTVLDLASFVLCHRFTSPSWCQHLARHVSTGQDQWFEEVMRLETGEALLFAPASLTGVDGAGNVRLLGKDSLRVRVRPRLTGDGGTSILAIGGQRSLVPDTTVGQPPLSPAESTPASFPAVPTPITIPDMYTSWLSPSLLTPPVPEVNASDAFVGTKIERRFQPLVEALHRRHSTGHERVMRAVVGQLLNHHRTSASWLKQLVNDARGAGIVEVGTQGKSTQWMKLIVSEPFVFI
ncbi:hypothetical protein BKA62DRAFT_42724 [Auriculariales sp. MPI-PUGE-AT-0066]|nr:hypothetical protein BKA62DRAFT_42724 [Auriculariales sp. MPI-PUGE-AT-0066]